MRSTHRWATIGLLAVIASALPVVEWPLPAQAQAHPVRPGLRELAVRGIDRATLSAQPWLGLRGADRRGEDAVPRLGSRGPRTAAATTSSNPAQDGELAALTPQQSLGRFSVIGVTWGHTDSRMTAATIQVRLREPAGWTAWQNLAIDDAEPDPGTADAARARQSTEPLVSDAGADGAQVRVFTPDGTVPGDLRIDAIAPGASAADPLAARPTTGPAASASAATAMPTIVRRAAWGADESLRSSGPVYTSTIRAAAIHHTAGVNGYTRAQVPAIIRGIYAYHTKVKGWSDIGYNFLVDRFGTIYEGRAGGVDLPVLGAHSGGFNTSTFGVALMGDFTTAPAPPAALAAVARLVAWKFGIHHVDPLGRVTLVSGGGTSKFAAGTPVSLGAVFGHRDVKYTECPGASVYAALPRIRAAVAQLMGFTVSDVSLDVSQVGAQPGAVTVRLTASRSGAYRLSVYPVGGTGAGRTLTGPLVAGSNQVVWNLADDRGGLVAPGRYRLSLWAGDRVAPTMTVASTAQVWTDDVLVGGLDTTEPVLPQAVPTATYRPGYAVGRLGETWTRCEGIGGHGAWRCFVYRMQRTWVPAGSGFRVRRDWTLYQLTYVDQNVAAWDADPRAHTGEYVSGSRSFRARCDVESGPRTCLVDVQAPVVIRTAEPGRGYRFVRSLTWVHYAQINLLAPAPVPTPTPTPTPSPTPSGTGT